MGERRHVHGPLGQAQHGPKQAAHEEHDQSRPRAACSLGRTEERHRDPGENPCGRYAPRRRREHPPAGVTERSASADAAQNPAAASRMARAGCRDHKWLAAQRIRPTAAASTTSPAARSLPYATSGWRPRRRRQRQDRKSRLSGQVGIGDLLDPPSFVSTWPAGCWCDSEPTDAERAETAPPAASQLPARRRRAAVARQAWMGHAATRLRSGPGLAGRARPPRSRRAEIA